jgi:hypothetical protein
VWTSCSGVRTSSVAAYNFTGMVTATAPDARYRPATGRAVARDRRQDSKPDCRVMSFTRQ